MQTYEENKEYFENALIQYLKTKSKEDLYALLVAVSVATRQGSGLTWKDIELILEIRA